LTRVAGVSSAGFNFDSIAPRNAQLHYPMNAVVDQTGNIYIPDHGNCRIRRILKSTGLIYTWMGNGGCGLSDGYTVDNSNIHYMGKVAFTKDFTYLYIPLWAYHRVQRVNMATQIATIVAGTGTAGNSPDGTLAMSANFYTPSKICFDNNGGYFLATYSNHRVVYVSPGGLVYNYAGTGAAAYNQDGLPGTSTNIYHPESCAIDNFGYLYIADHLNYRIRKVTNTRLYPRAQYPGFGGY